LIEISVIDYLSEKLPVAVYTEYPEEPPDTFIVIDRTNTEREDFVYTSVFVANSYAASKLAAAQLNEKVKAAMDTLADLEQVYASRLGSDYPFPDTKRKKHRYQAVYNISHY